MAFKLFSSTNSFTLYLSLLFKRHFFYDNATAVDIRVDVFLKQLKKKYNTPIYFLRQHPLSITESFLQAPGSLLRTQAIKLRRNTSITIMHLNAMRPAGSLSSVGLFRPTPGTEFIAFCHICHLAINVKLYYCQNVCLYLFIVYLVSRRWLLLSTVVSYPSPIFCL